MDDPVTKQTKLATDALQYAHDHNLDINKKDDVKKILDSIDLEHTQDVDEFMEVLKNADAIMDMMAKEKNPKKTDLPN